MSLKDQEARREYHRKWYLANRERVLENGRRWHKQNLEKHRNLGRSWELAHLEQRRERSRKAMRKFNGAKNPTGEQKFGPCELCKTETKLHYDHDHATGEFRGWLCILCNRGLGMFRDNPERLIAAIAYLAGRK